MIATVVYLSIPALAPFHRSSVHPQRGKCTHGRGTIRQRTGRISHHYTHQGRSASGADRFPRDMPAITARSTIAAGLRLVSVATLLLVTPAASFSPKGSPTTSFATFGNAQTKQLIKAWQPKPLEAPEGEVFLSPENMKRCARQPTAADTS